MKNKANIFHLAIPVNNLDESISFYKDTLELKQGRSSNKWVDFNFFGNQLVCHVTDEINIKSVNYVDGEEIPVPHFGVVLSMDEYDDFLSKINDKKINFIIEPTVRFKGEVGEQRIMFFKDPSGNAIEVKAFRDIKNLFRS